MTKESELYKVVSGNAFSQLGTKKIGEPVWVGPWFKYSSSKAHNVYYDKKVLPTNDSRDIVKINKLNRLTKFISFSLIKDCIAFAIIMLGIIYLFPLALVALGVSI